jgi:hypothetical protein
VKPVGPIVADTLLSIALARVALLEQVIVEAAALLPAGGVRSSLERAVPGREIPSGISLLRGNSLRAMTMRRSTSPTGALATAESGSAEVDRLIATAPEGGKPDAAAPTATSLDRGLLHPVEAGG